MHVQLNCIEYLGTRLLDLSTHALSDQNMPRRLHDKTNIFRIDVLDKDWTAQCEKVYKTQAMQH